MRISDRTDLRIYFPRTLRTLFALLCLAFTATGRGQVTTADVLGTVHDPGGAVVSGATVTLTDLDRHQVRTAITNDAGEYTFTLVQNGNYSLSIAASGF